MAREVEFGGQKYEFSWWQGEVLKGTPERPLSFDTETRAVAPARAPVGDETLADVPPHPLDVPQLALGMAHSESGTVLIHPSQMDKFVLAHKGQHWTGHNFAFDFWVLMKGTKSLAVKNALWEMGDAGRLHDSMVLDLLLQLSEGKFRHGGGKGGDDTRLYSTNLAVLAAEWEVGELDKTDPYRLRFGELIGLTMEEIDNHPEAEGFLKYAVTDVISEYLIWPRQRLKGIQLMTDCGWSPTKRKNYEIRGDALEKFGVLTEKVQVLASIVLAELSRTPIRVDQERRKRMEEECRARYQAALDLLVQREPELLKKSPEKWKVVKEGKGKNATKTRVLIKPAEILYTPKTGVPQFDQGKLTGVLKSEADRMGVKPFLTTGKTKGAISTSAKEWRVYSDRSEFIKSWVSLESETKHLQFLMAINAPVVYSRYNLMMSTNRTSSGAYTDYKKQLLLPSVNIQQIPRDDPKKPEDNLRPLFLAPEGKLWCAVDYSYLEFRAMAAVAKARYGESVMAKVTEDNTLKGGPDPHQVTGASIVGVPIEEFLLLDPKIQKEKRQQAKPANFGFMSGMGTRTFIEYAKGYGVTLTKEEAKSIRKAWKAKYTEMDKYLDDNLEESLLWGCKPGTKLPFRLTWLQKKRFGDFLRQEKDDPRDGKFTSEERELFWDVLEWVAVRKGDDKTLEDLQQKKITHRVRKLTYYRAATLPGLIRNSVSYSEQRNTNFQGPSATGSKLALWNLMRRGYELINFVHDEIGVAVPRHLAKAKQQDIERVMVSSMEYVLGEKVPVAVEGDSSPYWSKG